MMHSSSSMAVRHRACNPSPSSSHSHNGKDNNDNIDDENGGHTNIRASTNSGSNTIGVNISSNNTNLGDNKLHGRRHQRPRWNSKTTLVLGVALTIPSLCLWGMYKSSTSMKTVNIGSSPHFRHGDVRSKVRTGSSRFRDRREDNEDEPGFFERKKRRRYNDHAQLIDRVQLILGHNDEEEEEEEEDGNSIDEGVQSTDDDEGQSSHQSAVSEQDVSNDNAADTGGIISNGDGVQYQYQPRMLRLELQKQFSNKRVQGDDGINSRGGKPKLSHGDVLLSSVHRLPTYESHDIPPSERYITPYPDDDGYIDRLESVKKSKKYRNNEREALEDEVCQAKHSWQADAYPNCNILHEYELGQLIGMFGRAVRKKLRKNEGDGDELVKYMASGYWRDVWLLSKASGSFADGNITSDENTLSRNSSISEKEEITVLKTLRYKHEFSDRNYDRHRKDALASMRMSQSPNVVDIFAYCSNSAVFEYGKGGDIDAKIWPYDKEEGKYYVADMSSLEKIDIAYQVARAIADVHDVEDDGHASIAHTDITPSQFIFINGRWKLNDFNRCRFMRVRKVDGGPCGFYVGMNPGKFRAPEEYAFLEENEMIDIYSMGNIFYAMLSGNMPFEGQKESKAQKKVLDGVRPKIPTEVVESDDTAIQTLISITKKCWSKKPIDRPKAASVRDELKELLDRLMTSANATIEADERMR